ncbi:MAG: restriction endonuclease subunit S [Armatimonadetes bacterium]|nr:restriction endonuclease subunit S [Armatimonadota bacterium]
MSTRKSSLRNGWTLTPIIAVAEVNPRTPLPARDSDDVSISLYDMAAIDEARGTLTDPEMVPLRSGRSGKTKFTNGDVLFAKITPCVQNGKSAYVQGVKGGLAFGSSEFYVLRAKPSILPLYLFYFVRQQRVIDAAVASFTGSSGRQRVPSSFWDSLRIPVPPLPAQELIVAILKKADDIRGKRVDALNSADSILSSAFIAMFGDPNTNGNRFPRKDLGRLADVKSGVTKGRKLRGKTTVEVPYLRVANVQDGFLDLDEVKTIEVLPSDCEKYHLEDGDILMTEGGDPDKLGRGCIWREEINECIHQNHVFRVRTDRSHLLPEYLAALLRSRYAKHYFLSCAKRSSNLASVNSTQVKAFPIPVPPLSLQQKFVMAVEQWTQTAERLKTAQKRAANAFRSLLHHAFAGELTAEFERVNAERIEACQALEVQLPRLVALNVLCETAKRHGQLAAQASLLVTAMMKLLFLIQMKGSAKRHLYQFVPYHYGPFAKELYADLEKLQQDGLIRIDNGDEDKTRITLADPARAAELTAQLPEELREDVQAVLDEYGDLRHRELLNRVYEEFPAYAKKSRLRKKISKKAGRAKK